MMIVQLKSAILASALIGAATLAGGVAQAMPAAGLDPAVAVGSDLAPMVQDARWVCGPYRCRWVPNRWVAPRPFWGPRPFYHRPYRYWGWRRHW